MLPKNQMNNQSNSILLLADGSVYHGKAFGKKERPLVKFVFNTGMTGYQEVFTDPSYYGQVVIMNNVHIGNYGVKDTDVESATVKIQGLIGRSLEELYSRKQAQGSLDAYLKENNVVSIEDIDTRALVTHVRTKGAMNCIISSEITDVNELKSELSKAPDMNGLELASKVSTKVAYELGDTNSDLKSLSLIMGLNPIF